MLYKWSQLKLGHLDVNDRAFYDATKSKGFLYRWFEEIAKKCWQRLLPLMSSPDFGAPKGRLLFSLQLGSKLFFLCHKEYFFFNKNTRLENYCNLTKMSCYCKELVITTHGGTCAPCAHIVLHLSVRRQRKKSVTPNYLWTKRK